MSTTARNRIALALMLVALSLAVPRPAQAWDVFGLFPSSVTGICSAVSPTYVAVLDGQRHPHVFVVQGDYRMPPAVVPGRRIKVTYSKRSDGLLIVKKVDVL